MKVHGGEETPLVVMSHGGHTSDLGLLPLMGLSSFLTLLLKLDFFPVLGATYVVSVSDEVPTCIGKASVLIYRWVH